MMIVKIKQLLLGILFACLMGSCSSFLTAEIQDVLLKENYWKHRDHAVAALSGVYHYFGTNATQLIRLGDLRSELYVTIGGGVSSQQMIEQEIKTNNGYADWGAIYSGINQANSFLKNAHLVLENDNSFSEQEYTEMMGEVYALRALYYFYLVRAFEDVPLHMHPYESDTQAAFVAVTDHETVLDTIESDLKRALKMAPLTFSDPNKKVGRITQNAVKAIWADVKLWRGDYDSCITFCEELDKDYRSNLLEGDAWLTMFTVGNSDESIFEYQFVNEKKMSPLYILFNNERVNVAGLLYNYRKVYPPVSLELTSDTVRFERTMMPSSTSSTPYVFKYMGASYDNGYYVLRNGVGTSRVNFIVYRYREILLMKAEALGHMGRFEEAIDEINLIREATLLEPTTIGVFGTGDTFFDKLLSERVTELGYEGKQWFSMVRIARQTKNKDLLIDRVAENNPYAKEQIIKARLQEEEGWFMPYHQGEVDNNHLIEQKPFYKGKE